jgi:ectoine hydroxylase-related dioxygenase (phytanoyl-CoA dioxygenase family)
VSHFLENGYLIAEKVFEATEMDSLIDRLGGLNAEPERPGYRHLMADPAVCSLASDPRLIELVENISGERMLPFKATLFNKAGKANWLVAWHQDTALPVVRPPSSNDWGTAAMKDGITFCQAPARVLREIVALRIHIDNSGPDNGPLRVIPGSHNERLSDKEIDRVVTDGPQVTCTVGKGGVIAMRPLIVHASSKCTSDRPRRVLHIEFAPSLDIDAGVWLAIA